MFLLCFISYLFFLQAMVHPDPLARPAANRLANLQNLRGTNSSNVKSRSQLYQELKETKSKLKMLELELSLTKGNNTDSETPKSSVSSKSHRLIGRGCARSRSSNVIGSTSTPKKW